MPFLESAVYSFKSKGSAARFRKTSKVDVSREIRRTDSLRRDLQRRGRYLVSINVGLYITGKEDTWTRRMERFLFHAVLATSANETFHLYRRRCGCFCDWEGFEKKREAAGVMFAALWLKVTRIVPCFLRSLQAGGLEMASFDSSLCGE